MTSKPQKKNEVMLKGAESSIDAPIKVHTWRCCIISASAWQTGNHSFSLSFSNVCDKQNKSDLSVDYERWGGSFGEGN